MNTPMQTMLAQVDWQATDNVGHEADGLPYATHIGVIDLMGHKLRCYRLNTGQTVFEAGDVQEFFGMNLTDEQP